MALFPVHVDILYPMVEPSVTTVITGNCDFSPAAIRTGDEPFLNAFAEFCLEREMDCTWQGLGEFLDTLSAG